MSLKIPWNSTVTLLNNLRTNELLTAVLHLYTQNVAPLNTDTAATYAPLEAAFGGYAAQTINDWGPVALNPSNVAQMTAGTHTFTATGAGLPVTIYGVYVLDNGGNLLYAELNPQGGITLTAAGQAFDYVPVFTLFSQF